MYQKRSAWILTGVAPERGEATSLADIELAVQTEIPLLKQHLCDSAWALRGRGRPRRTMEPPDGRGRPTLPRPVPRDEHRSRFRHRRALLPRPSRGSGGHRRRDRLRRPRLSAAGQGALLRGPVHLHAGTALRASGRPRPLRRRPAAPRRARSRRPRPVLGLCCHPYDVCTELIAREAGVIVTDPWGRRSALTPRRGTRRGLGGLCERRHPPADRAAAPDGARTQGAAGPTPALTLRATTPPWRSFGCESAVATARRHRNCHRHRAGREAPDATQS